MSNKATWFDNLIGFFSPRTKMNRLRFRQANTLLEKRKYEGAGSGRRFEGWHTTGTSANTEIATGIIRLRNRSRDLIRNNPYAARGIQVIESNVIGPGIRAEIKNTSTKLQQKRLRDSWEAWALTPACDYEGRQNMFGLQREVMRAVVESGEVFIRRRVTPTMRQAISPRTGGLVTIPPLELQILESDFLDSSTFSTVNSDNGNPVISGIELDDGKRVAYKMFKSHPGGTDFFTSTFDTVSVPADEIIHIYRQDRPGQLRGVPWLAPVMVRLRDFDDYEDAQLMRQKIASCLVAFVHDLQGLDESVECESELGTKMEPGQIEFLPPGKDVKLSSPPATPGYDTYSSVVLHSIAAGLGITYEAMTGNLSEVSFSSARMGHLEFSRNISTWRQDLILGQMLWPISSWFLQGMEFIGQSTNGATITWSSPRREMVDPSKETDAIKTQVRSGFLSLSEAVRMSGADPDKHFEEIKSDNERLDSLELTLDTDPRKDSDRIQPTTENNDED